MGTFRFRDYPKVLRARAKRLKNMKSPSEAGRFMVRRAKLLAPNYRGETINSIRKRKAGKNAYMVESFVRGSFKQNIWSNRGVASVTAGAQGVPGVFHAPRMRWNRKGGEMQKTVYGTVKAKWTGTGGWFNIAAQNTQKKFKNLTIKEVNDVMKSS